MSLLNYAAISSQEMIFKLLRGNYLNVDSKAGQALHLAVQSFPNLVSLVINNGGRVNARGPGGASPLHMAVNMDVNKEAVNVANSLFWRAPT